MKVLCPLRLPPHQPLIRLRHCKVTPAAVLTFSARPLPPARCCITLQLQSGVRTYKLVKGRCRCVRASSLRHASASAAGCNDLRIPFIPPLVLQIGESIQRQPRQRGTASSTVPKKPDSGWSLLVTPLKAGLRKGPPFVAEPGGHKRDLTADEQLYLKHFKKQVLHAVLFCL